ncbi:hypothetical protein AB1E18_012666 [Capra hircus]
MSGSDARPLATVKLEGACARPASWSRLVTWNGAETAVQRRALRLPPSCPPATTRDGGQPPGKREGRGCCQVLSSDWLSGNLRQLRGKDYLASRMRNRDPAPEVITVPPELWGRKAFPEVRWYNLHFTDLETWPELHGPESPSP